MTDLLASPQPAVALIQRDDRGLRATGAFSRFNVAFDGDARPGDLIATVGSPARPVKRLGRPSSAKAVIAALALHNGHEPFSAELEAAAQHSAAQADSYQRRDLRDLLTFTIDGDSTRDFDDALSARREGPCIRVWVHVADVAAFVRPGDALDLEARRRATSVYLPSLTVPMLPQALSTGACSLVPGKDRAAVTCELLLRDGVVEQLDIYRSRIRSDARLTYTHVEDIFLGRAEPGATYAAALAAARQAAVDRTLRAAEHGEEAVFEFTGDEVTAIRARPQQESQRLIERLMVLANQEVAAFLHQRGAPSLYRTHAADDPQRTTRALQRLAALGVDVDEPSPRGAWEAVDRWESDHGPSPALRSVAWQTRPPAAYSRELSAHEGLGLEAYCHFTSPIRRYADLIVHRALLAELGAEKVGTAPRYVELPDIAEHCNDRNRQARKLERRAGDICRVSLLRHRLREQGLSRQLTGTVAGMSDNGLFVSVDCADGLLSGRDLGGRPDPTHTCWTTAGGRELRLGERVAVHVRALDPVRGQIRLALR